MNFKPTHYVILAVTLLICFFSFAAYDSYLKNQPDIVPQDTVETILEEIMEGDSIVNIPIRVSYKYEDIDFSSNGDTTYWFFKAEVKNKKNENYTNTRVISFPHSHFDFLGASNYVSDKNTKSIFIIDFCQISKASYKSYSPYAKKW